MAMHLPSRLAAQHQMVIKSSSPEDSLIPNGKVDALSLIMNSWDEECSSLNDLSLNILSCTKIMANWLIL